MKKLTLILLIFISTLALSSCSKPSVPVYLEGTDYDTVAALALPYADHILEGIESNDYSIFATDFDETMTKAMTEEKFSALVKSFTQLGASQSTELVSIEDKEDFYGVNFDVTYPDKVIRMLLVVNKAEPNLVSGLWFK